VFADRNVIIKRTVNILKAQVSFGITKKTRCYFSIVLVNSFFFFFAESTHENY
jgi:hypothetical protein